MWIIRALIITAHTAFCVNQTYVTCNPRTDPSCYVRNKALGCSYTELFETQPLAFIAVHGTQGVSYSQQNHLELILKKRFDNPFLVSDFYILYGRVEIVLKGATGRGIISSVYLQSDDLDEIDVELFGADPFEFQSNYFVKGNVLNYDRGQYHPTPGSPLDNFFTYVIDWRPDRIEWHLNGNIIRTVLRENNPHGFPNAPMAVKLSLWAGGDVLNEQGTIEWAGGITDYSLLPFTMNVHTLKVIDYTSATEYAYGNDQNSWIEVDIDRPRNPVGKPIGDASRLKHETSSNYPLQETSRYYKWRQFNESMSGGNSLAVSMILMFVCICL